MSEVSIVKLKPQLVIGMRKKGCYRGIAEMIPAICQYADSKKAKFCGPPIFICHENAEEAIKANEEGNADLEVAVPIEKKIEETDEIKCYELEGGSFAKIVHKGPYQECCSAYRKLFKWIAEQGKKVCGPTREYYLNDPNVIKPEGILTEIYAPIE